MTVTRRGRQSSVFTNQPWLASKIGHHLKAKNQPVQFKDVYWRTLCFREQNIDQILSSEKVVIFDTRPTNHTGDVELSKGILRSIQRRMATRKSTQAVQSSISKKRKRSGALLAAKRHHHYDLRAKPTPIRDIR